MSRKNEVETLRMRQRVHDLKAAEPRISIREMQRRFDISYASVRDWLARPRPTDEEVEACIYAVRDRAVDHTGLIPVKLRMEPEIHARLCEEMELQGAAKNRIINCAVLLYLDCMRRARGGGSEPVYLMGYRA